MVFSEMSNLWRIIFLLFLLIPVVGDMCVLPSVFFCKNNDTAIDTIVSIAVSDLALITLFDTIRRFGG